MKKLLLIAFALIGLGGAGSAVAQAELFLRMPSDSSGFGFGVPLDVPITRMTVQNVGDQASSAFRVKFWVSVDNVFTEEDQPVTSNSLTLPACLTPNNCPSSTVQRTFVLPTSIEPSPPEMSRLFNDSRAADEWMGERVYYQACLSIRGGPFTDCRTSSVIMIGPRSTRARASNNTIVDAIELTWDFVPRSNGNDLVTHIKLDKRNNANNQSTSRTIPISEIETTTLTNGRQVYRVLDSDVDSGVVYSYVPRNCNDASGTVLCQNGTGVASGSPLFGSTVSTGTVVEGIQVDWSDSGNGKPYVLVRCPVNGNGSCLVLDIRFDKPGYLDTTVGPGQRYSYIISECDVFDADDICQDFGQELFTTSVGYSRFVDAFEQDDTAAQAKTIDSSVSQLRSLDTRLDEDWLEIILRDRANLEIGVAGELDGTDTEITLFDANLNRLAFSNESFPRQGLVDEVITQTGLPSGRYYLKVNQPASSNSNGPFSPYSLNIDIELSTGSVTVRPDSFEVDNRWQQARLVNKSVTQTRTMHVPDDQDWIRLEVPTTQTVRIQTFGLVTVDTFVRVYDDKLQTVYEENGTPGVATQNVLIMAEDLPAGTYYVQITQPQKSGFPYLPIPSYGLEIEMAEKPIILAPILHLLLDDV